MQAGLPRIALTSFITSFRWKDHLGWIQQHWFELIIGSLFAYLLLAKDVSISFKINTPEQIAYLPPASKQSGFIMPTAIKNTSFKVGEWLDSRKKDQKKESVQTETVPKAQHFSNLTFIMSPTYAQRKNIPDEVVEEKLQNCKNYLKKYGKTALVEQEKYGILASITLAQGLLESNAGDSRLARESNNHFGIKCRRKCKGCTCRNYHDDDIYDMFRVFKNPLESFREHSILLNNSRYRGLKAYGKDYKKWATGLKKAGYATDRRYAEKLILIIEALQLYKYDN